MSVPEGQRGKGKFTVLTKANMLSIYTVKICCNKKVFLPEYQHALTDDIIRTAKDIFIHCWTANNIRVGKDEEKRKERRRLQEQAANDCNNLLALMADGTDSVPSETETDRILGRKNDRSQKPDKILD